MLFWCFNWNKKYGTIFITKNYLRLEKIVIVDCTSDHVQLDTLFEVANINEVKTSGAMRIPAHSTYYERTTLQDAGSKLEPKKSSQ